MYFPRRSTDATCSPSSSASTSAGSSGSVKRGSWIRTRAERPPDEARLESRAVRLDLGKLGQRLTKNVEDERMRDGRRVADLVRREHLVDGGRGGCLVAGMHLREHVALRDGIAALAMADHADRVVDLVVLRCSPGAQMESCHANGDRSQPPDVARPRRCDLVHDRRHGQRTLVGISALRRDPPAPDIGGGTVRDRLLREPSAFGLVHAEI